MKKKNWRMKKKERKKKDEKERTIEGCKRKNEGRIIKERMKEVLKMKTKNERIKDEK